MRSLSSVFGIGKHTRFFGLFNVIWYAIFDMGSIEALYVRSEGTYKEFYLLQLFLGIAIIISLFIKTNKPYINISIVIMRYIYIVTSILNGMLHVYYEHGRVLNTQGPIIVIVIIIFICYYMIIKYQDERNIEWLHLYSGKYLFVIEICAVVCTSLMSIQLVRF